jgi:hypothetical protein
MADHDSYSDVLSRVMTKCSDLRTQRARPDNIRVFGPRLAENIRCLRPILGENGPTIIENSSTTSARNHIIRERCAPQWMNWRDRP